MRAAGIPAARFVSVLRSIRPVCSAGIVRLWRYRRHWRRLAGERHTKGARGAQIGGRSVEFLMIRRPYNCKYRPPNAVRAVFTIVGHGSALHARRLQSGGAMLAGAHIVWRVVSCALVPLSAIGASVAEGSSSSGSASPCQTMGETIRNGADCAVVTQHAPLGQSGKLAGLKNGRGKRKASRAGRWSQPRRSGSIPNRGAIEPQAKQ